MRKIAGIVLLAMAFLMGCSTRQGYRASNYSRDPMQSGRPAYSAGKVYDYVISDTVPVSANNTSQTRQITGNLPDTSSTLTGNRRATEKREAIKLTAPIDTVQKISRSSVSSKPNVSGFALAGFCIAVMGIFFLLLVGFPIFAGFLAVLFSSIGLYHTRKKASVKRTGKGFAIIGLILGIALIALFWMFILFLLFVFGRL